MPMPFRHPRLWWLAQRAGARISSSAVVRGSSNLALGKRCRIGRQAEINASTGSITLGDEASLGPFVVVESRGGQIRIGCRSTVGPFCVLYGHGGLQIGSDCLIASHVVFVPEQHVFSRTDLPIRNQGGTRMGIRVEDDVWIATGVVVMDGVTIGRGAVVGAGAVVTKDIPAYAVARGVPARIVGQRGSE
jgi:acetyltransferase-like isoleucine patch superfamily enzyme